jgi:hypothetical protein
MQILNVYADQLSQGLLPEAAEVTFYVRRGEGEELGQVRGQGSRGLVVFRQLALGLR